MDAAGAGSAESASASVDGEVPSIVLEPGLGRDGGSSANTDGPPDRYDANSEGARTPRLNLSLQPDADGAANAHRKSPVTVQEWVDSLPASDARNEEECEELPVEDGEEALDLGLGAEAGLLYNGCPPVTIVSPSHPCVSPSAFGAVCDPRLGRQREVGPGLVRESSVQSDVTSHGSHGSSVDSYLESRKPDPEEVLLNLGFGGPPVTENEVSRIPRRFLQPSKVKGVAIDDFLRYQQDLIENFETGFCGYRGLTGSSHTPPSVIVAKIREKLRGSHSLSLSLSEEGGSSAPASEAPRRRFSRAARRVLRSLPQDSHLSVLTPDNRRFLDNQGRNKSPDVPRKRIVFGARSFTFAGDGDLVEVEARAQAQAQTPTPLPHTQIPPLPMPTRPRPLLHKDSVLSSATSLSMTSLDSDSDTDEGSYERRHLNRQSSHPRLAALPQTYNSLDLSSQTVHTVLNTTGDSDSSTASGTVQRPRFSKRISSTSISSWESESPHARFHLQSPTFDSPNTSRPVRYESIDEDVEMTFGGTLESSVEVSGEKTEDSQMCEINGEKQKISEDIKISGFFSNNERDSQNGNCVSETVAEIVAPPLHESVFSHNSVGVSDVQSIQSDQERLFLRRSSLKRQNRVTDEDMAESETSETTRMFEAVSASDSVPILKFTIHETGQQGDNGLGRMADSIERDGSQETLVSVPKADSSNFDIAGDIQVMQDQFLQPSKGTGKCTMTNSSESSTIKEEPISGNLLAAVSATGDESFEMEELMTCDEETNGEPLLLARTRSDSSGFLEGERSPPPQAPPSDDASHPAPDPHVHPPPIGGCVNMFSSCSDESVVHVPSRDLQELLDELAGRGLQLPDSASFACQTGAEQQMEAVRMALETFSEQLASGGKTKVLDMEGAAEQLRKQIASELRHVAALLEDQPESQAAAVITRQVTALLREQTRLCHQLEMLTGCSDEMRNSFSDAAPSTSHCCCESELVFEAVREENRRLGRIVDAHSAELAEIRQILTKLLDRDEVVPR